jgi:hypothetical protein
VEFVEEMVFIKPVSNAMMQIVPHNQKSKGEHTHADSLPHANPQICQNRVHLSPSRNWSGILFILTGATPFAEDDMDTILCPRMQASRILRYHQISRA